MRPRFRTLSRIQDIWLDDVSPPIRCAPTSAWIARLISARPGASRAQLCRNVLGPALARGEWIVLDRFTDSTLAYQGYGRGFDVDTLRRMNDFATGEVRPALTLLLDLPAEEGLGRALARSGGKDRIESAPIDFHRRLREGYLELARREPGRFAVIDATAPVDAVSAAVRRAVEYASAAYAWEGAATRIGPRILGPGGGSRVRLELREPEDYARLTAMMQIPAFIWLLDRQ